MFRLPRLQAIAPSELCATCAVRRVEKPSYRRAYRIVVGSSKNIGLSPCTGTFDISISSNNHTAYVSTLSPSAPLSPFSRVLGQGSFASVKLAVRKTDGTKWAVKVIEKASLSQEDEEALKTEVSILEVWVLELGVSSRSSSEFQYMTAIFLCD